MKHGLGLGLCTALVAGALAATAPAVSAACERVEVETYEIQVEVGRKVYHRGDTARIEGIVTRKDTGIPVAGARFVAVVPFRKTILYGIEKTDANGHATASLKLRKKDVETGPARLWVYAYQEVADTICGPVVEYGFYRDRRAFVIKP